LSFKIFVLHADMAIFYFILLKGTFKEPYLCKVAIEIILLNTYTIIDDLNLLKERRIQ
jgi:hypothetical protein